MSLPQPFLDGLGAPLEHKKEIAKIKTWIASQPHLPEISDEYALLFLHACYYSLDKTKTCIDSYFTIRTNNPDIFGDRDLHAETTQNLMKLAEMARLPTLTAEGYRVLLYRLADTDYRKLIFHEGVKAFCMVNDVILSEDRLTEGYVIIFDMKGIALGHLARVSLPALKVFMQYIQEAHPVRLKAIHVLNTASFINHVMRLVAPLVRSELLGLLRFHSGTNIAEVPVQLMPEDYGGEQPPVKVLHDEQFAMMVRRYGKWLLQQETMKVDESKRPRKASWLSIFTGGGGANREEQPGFRNLTEID